MANSPLFGWEEPDDTDLVKDGAAAIRTLGNAIDTSMGDLLGGTTGQVLSKASNSNMDFTWVTSDDANAIQNAIVDAKGDLIAATANDTPARLAVGNNGETLVADSSTATGLRWQGTYEAGSNFLINGGMDIWQRGTSFTPGSFDPKYTADRWLFFVGTGSNTLSQETTTLPTGARYALKWVSGAAGGTYGIYQAIETANTIPLAGKTVTIQAQVTGTTGKTASIQFTYSTGVDTAPLSVTTSIANSSNVTFTSGTYSTLTLTATVPSNAKTIKVGIVSGDTFANTEYVTLGNVKLEVGSVATQFTRAGGTIAGELAACQRYYQLIASGTQKFIAPASCYTSGQLDIMLTYPEMRIAPTLSVTTGTGYYVFVRNGGTDAFNSITLNGYTTPRGAALYNNTEIASTAGNAGWVYIDNASGSVALSAEL